VKKILSIVVLFMVLSAGAAFADNVKVRPLSALTMTAGTWDSLSGTGVPDAWCNVGGLIDGLAFFDVKGTGTVKVKVKIFSSNGTLVGSSGPWPFDFSSTAWEGWYLYIPSFSCQAEGIYTAVIEFKTPWNGVVKKVSTKVNIF
jgi:hypothetical protein